MSLAALSMIGLAVFASSLVSGIFGLAGGMILDISFRKSDLDRRTTVATKAASQSIGNVLRFVYFGSIGNALEAIPVWAFAAAVLLAIAGTSLAPLVLDRMTDHGFRQWTR